MLPLDEVNLFQFIFFCVIAKVLGKYKTVFYKYKCDVHCGIYLNNVVFIFKQIEFFCCCSASHDQSL